MATVTISVRIPEETRDWLERFSKARGSVGASAARLLEEAMRRERFPGIEFRDTPLGRVAHVAETRVQLALAATLILEEGLDPAAIATHYRWPLWKARSVAGYIRAHEDEVRSELRDLRRYEDGFAGGDMLVAEDGKA